MSPVHHTGGPLRSGPHPRCGPGQAHAHSPDDQRPPAHTHQQALEDLRKVARARPAVQLRLRRLARLLLAGRALKLQGDPCRVQATRTALRAYAAREAEVSTTVTPEAALHHLRRAPVHLSVHDQDGWPITEYRLERAGGGVNATWSDGHTRFLPDSVFLAQFRLAVFTLRVRGPLPEAPQMAAELARRHDWPHVLAALPD